VLSADALAEASSVETGLLPEVPLEVTDEHPAIVKKVLKQRHNARHWVIFLCMFFLLNFQVLGVFVVFVQNARQNYQIQGWDFVNIYLCANILEILSIKYHNEWHKYSIDFWYL
jgi:hypothetical protein